MSTRVKAVLLTLLIAVPAFLLNPVLFPPPAGAPAPTASQALLLQLLTAFDSLLLGAGVAFVVFGWPLVSRCARGSRARAIALFVAVAWLTISWYPHIGLHTSIGNTFAGILAIDYGFHVPLYIIAVMMIWGLAGYLQLLAEQPSTASGV